jgi:predicted nucleotidyltransferase
VRTGVASPRGRFEAAVRSDDAVVAALYTGSLAAGTADVFSDVDVELVVGTAVTEPRAVLESLAEAFGRTRFRYWRGELLTAFAGPSWQRLDLRCVPESALEPSPRLAGARVFKDRDGRAAKRVAASPPQVVSVTSGDARLELSAAVDTQIYAALHIARGALWSAQGELSHRAGALYGLVARLRGVEPYGFRHVESLLDPAERTRLEAAWPRAARRRELRRAARALWRWSEVARGEAIARLGAEVAPEVDAAELLAAVERIHARRSQ